MVRFLQRKLKLSPLSLFGRQRFESPLSLNGKERRVWPVIDEITMTEVEGDNYSTEEVVFKRFGLPFRRESETSIF